MAAESDGDDDFYSIQDGKIDSLMPGQIYYCLLFCFVCSKTNYVC